MSGNGLLQAEALLYLAAAGVGRIGIYAVESSPLLAALVPDQQASSVIALQRLNQDCTIVMHDHAEVGNRAHDILLVQQYDLVIAEPHVQLHAACYAACRPFLCSEVSATTIRLAVYRGYEEGLPCFSCESPSLFAITPPPDVEDAAALFAGTVLATEAIKLILGLHPSGPTKLLQYDFPTLSFHEHILSKNSNCSVCRS